MAETRDTGDERAAGTIRQWSGVLLLGFLLANLLLFAAYRLLFLASFSTSAVGFGPGARVLLYGLRLDVALIGLEACIAIVVSVLLFRVRPRLWFGAGWFLTWLNALYTFADFEFYREGNRHMGRVLRDRVSNPHEIFTEIANFATSSPFVLAMVIALSILYFWWGRRIRNRLPDVTFRLLRPWWKLPAMVAVCVLLLVPSVEPVTSKKERGYSLLPASSRHYAVLDSFLLHEAIQNPLHETLVVHLPLLFLPLPEDKLDAEEAEIECAKRLGRLILDRRYPLLREVKSSSDLGIENVFLIQVEGLTASMMEHDEDGEPVMPFLRKFAEVGIYFRNTIQGFNNTAGGIFCTVTGLPRPAVGVRKARLFTADELSGYFGSLPRILGDRYEHRFFAAYRQSHYDYTAFMGNQGYTALGYPDFHGILEARGTADEEECRLGLYDGPFLRECARLITEIEGPFTAHAMTSTTHAPWPVPENFSGPFDNPRLNSFRYTDESLRRCVELLDGKPGLLEKTLLIVVADHTGPTFGDDYLERKRIPLILLHPSFRFRGLEGTQEQLATHADILPTILALLGGKHRVATLGRNLFNEASDDGVISGARDEGLYMSGDFALHWRLNPEEVRLLRVEDGKLGHTDVSDEERRTFEWMYKEYFGQYETVRRLMNTGRIYPRD